MQIMTFWEKEGDDKTSREQVLRVTTGQMARELVCTEQFTCMLPRQVSPSLSKVTNLTRQGIHSYAPKDIFTIYNCKSQTRKNKN